jgi:hypothetical protein
VCEPDERKVRRQLTLPLQCIESVQMTPTNCMAQSATPLSESHAAAARRGGGCELPIDISEEFVADTLKPYRPNSKYLHRAQITHVQRSESPEVGVPLVTAAGTFSIPESCYIDNTGHFNAVEFNICYNQLAYVMFGKCFETGIAPKLRFLTLPEYRRHQLQSCYIVSLESRFLKQLNSQDFRAELMLNKVSWLAGVLFCFTAVAFSDCDGVKAHGPIVLAFKPPAGAVTH